MRMELGPEREAFRLEVRRFLEEHWDPEAYERDAEELGAWPAAGRWHAVLQQARLVVPHWPERYGGRGLGMLERFIVMEELGRIGAPPPGNPIALGWAGPTIMTHGTREQMDRFLLPMAEATEIWCQLFSEPDAGSDLAGLTTRAERDGDEWVVTGRKIWSSIAHVADYGILLARTDPDAPKHKGITYFLLPMHQPGVEIRPIRQMDGNADFNEVFLDAARIPAGHVVGEVNDGWRVAVTTLMNERVSLSSGRGLLWGNGPAFVEVWRLVEELASEGRLGRRERVRWAELWERHHVIRSLKLRVLSALEGDRPPGTEAAVEKIVADRYGQDVMDALMDLLGPDALVWDAESRRWVTGFLFSRALTIGGGTEEVQKNILGERALGLPPEPRPDKAGTFREAARRI